MKRFAIRAARKSAHLSNRVLKKASRFSDKVEDKATRILSGTDYSFQIEESIPLEKIYYNAIPFITPLNPALPAIGSTPSVTLLVPSLKGSSFFGGTATALVVAAKIAIQENLRLRIVQTLETGHPSNLSRFFKDEGIDINKSNIQVISVADRAYNIYGYLSMHPDDIYIASAWWDAFLLDKLPLIKKYIYLIQDFEPIFYNNSDFYVLAEETYKSEKFVPLCNTRLMAEFMKSRNYPSFKSLPDFFEPAVSRIDSGKASDPRGRKKRLFLYGRPNVHRNLFFTSLSAIDYAFKSGFLNRDEWECYMAGQDGIPDIDLPSRVKIKNLGKMSISDYVKFSKKVDLALSPMMAPHPNYPTLEFASIGSAVVTTKYANKQDLVNYSRNIVMCDIDAESMAGAINVAAKMDYETRMKNLFHTGAISKSWASALDDTLRHVVKKLKY